MDGLDPAHVPLGVPPSGQLSNLINAQSRAWIPRLAVYTTLPVSLCFVIMRLFTRIRMRHIVGWDDCMVTPWPGNAAFILTSKDLCILSACASAGLCGIVLAQLLDDTYGRHYWDVPLSAITPELMMQTCAITSAYDVCAALTKVSLLALFLRIFAPSRRSKIMIWAGIAFTVVSYAALLGVWIHYSVPNHGDAGWTDVSFYMRVANYTPTVSVVFGVLGIVTDFYVIAIPLTAISSLNLSTKKKLGVSALFVTGLLACAFCVAGLSPRIQNFQATVINSAPDPFWLSMPSYGLAIAEINLGIVCACVPVIIPLLKGLLAKLSPPTSTWKRYWKKKAGYWTDIHDLEAGKRGPTQNHNYYRRNLLSLSRRPQKPRRALSTGTVKVTHTTDIHMEPYSELRSIDMDYHKYLGGGKQNSHIVGAQGGMAG